MPKIKNKHYRKFLDEGAIDIIEDHHIMEAIKNVDGIYGKHIAEGRALIIVLFYSGARPAEVLNLKAKDIYKDGGKIMIKISGVKRGLPRTLTIPTNRPLSQRLWKYAETMPLESYLFYNYRSNHVRTYTKKKGEEVKKLESSDKLRYHFNKWFKGVLTPTITPYFLRHSRFSKFAEKGASIQDIQMWKGARRSESVMPYLHMTIQTSKKLSRML